MYCFADAHLHALEPEVDWDQLISSLPDVMREKRMSGNFYVVF